MSETALKLDPPLIFEYAYHPSRRYHGVNMLEGITSILKSFLPEPGNPNQPGPVTPAVLEAAIGAAAAAVGSLGESGASLGPSLASGPGLAPTGNGLH